MTNAAIYSFFIFRRGHDPFLERYLGWDVFPLVNLLCAGQGVVDVTHERDAAEWRRDLYYVIGTFPRSSDQQKTCSDGNARRRALGARPSPLQTRPSLLERCRIRGFKRDNPIKGSQRENRQILLLHLLSITNRLFIVSTSTPTLLSLSLCLFIFDIDCQKE